MDRLFVCLMCLVALEAARAAVLLSDAFDYPNGSLVSVSGGTWQTHSGTPGQVNIASGSAVLTGSESEDVSALLAGQPYPGGSYLTMYAGFTVRFTSLPGSPGTYFAHFKDGASGYRPKVFATTTGAAAGQLRLGLSRVANAPDVILNTDLALNTDYRVVVRYALDTGASTLWINPQAESDPSVSATDDATLITVTSFAFRQSSADGGMGAMNLDDLLVATTFEEAIGEEPPPPPTQGAMLSVLTYNTRGNNAADWSTNSPQVRAIGRQMQALAPDIITFQEIPLTNTWEMTNFVMAFLPGYALADNSGTDGFIRSVILSRHPILRSTKWLDGVDLKPFGYTNANPNLDNFTRDLFETEIAVPGFAQPVHVFTTHLKAGTDPDSVARRAAEASAISNFFVAGFLTTNSQRAYLLTGDLNEDIAAPPSGSGQPVQRLTSAPTGLKLTTPVNPYSGSEKTWSIQGSLNRRYDYILPGGVLFSNISSSQVFRSDLVPAPLPPPLLSGDSVAASDHLPVLMTFASPDPGPFRILSVVASNALVTLIWESVTGQSFVIEGAAQPGGWEVVASNLTATGATLQHSLSITSSHQLLRVRRVQ